MKVYAPVGEETFDGIEEAEEAQAGANPDIASYKKPEPVTCLMRPAINIVAYSRGDPLM